MNNPTTSAQIDSWLSRYEKKGTVLSNAKIADSMECYYDDIGHNPDISKQVKNRKGRINKLLGIREHRRALAPLGMIGIPMSEINASNLKRWKGIPEVLCSELDEDHHYGQVSSATILGKLSEDDCVKCSVIVTDIDEKNYIIPVLLGAGIKKGDILVQLCILEGIIIPETDIDTYTFLDIYPVKFK